MSACPRSACVLAALLCGAFAFAGSALAQPARVGEVARMVPDVFIEREQQKSAAQAKAAVRLQDTVSTERHARARLRMDDGSVLNVGAESALKIIAHDAAAERSELELAAGRIRARVVKRVGSGGRFEVRTPTAVAGVVGTHFVVSIAGDHTEVLCIDGEVTVRNADATVQGSVTLRAGQFTRVFLQRAPEPARQATPEQLQQAVEQTDIAAGPFQWSRVEVSWPPAGCGENAQLNVRAWVKEMRGEQTAEVPLESDLVSGTLLLGGERVDVEDGRGVLPGGGGSMPANIRFTPRRAPASEVAVKGWDPQKLTAGEGWRSPRAVFTGSAFYVLGPLGRASAPQFDFGGQPAQLLWSGPCGAGFLAPTGAGGEYEVSITWRGQALARGRMNLIHVSYRTPVPPTVMRGQTSRFGVDLHGLSGLAAIAQGRPVLTARIINTTPQIIGNLKSNTKGAKVSGQSIDYSVGASQIDNGGTARLDGSGRAHQRGTFVLHVNLDLDDALEEPRTPMTAASGK